MRTKTKHGIPRSALALLALLALPLAAASADSTVGWSLAKATLPSDKDVGNGMVAKAGEVQVWHHASSSDTEQRTAVFTLAKNYAFPNGITAKAGTSISFYPNGAIRFMTLTSDWTPPGTAQGVAIPAGTAIKLYDDGAFQGFTLKTDAALGPGQPRVKAGEYVGFLHGGSFETVVFADTVPVPGFPLNAAAGKRVEFYSSGKLKSFRPSAPGLVYPGISAGIEEDVTLDEASGKVVICGLSAPFRTKAGVLVDDSYAEFDSSGTILKGTLGESFVAKSGSSFKSGDYVAFSADGAPTASSMKPEDMAASLSAFDWWEYLYNGYSPYDEDYYDYDDEDYDY
jgi:hypothetical protein